MTPLSGGHWVTIHGHHVYLKGTKLLTNHVEAAADLVGLPADIKQKVLDAHANGQLTTDQQVHNVVSDVAGAIAVGLDEDHALQTAIGKHGSSTPVAGTGTAWSSGLSTTPVYVAGTKKKAGAHVSVITHGSAIVPGEIDAYAAKFGLSAGGATVLSQGVADGTIQHDTHLAQLVADAVHISKMTGQPHSMALKSLLAGKTATQIIADQKAPPTVATPPPATPSAPSAPSGLVPGSPPIQSVGKLDHAHFASIPDVSVGEGPLPPLKNGQSYSAGILIVEPDGKIWLYEPKGHFAGYEHTFSKGGVENGLSHQQSAHKELYEELGLTAQITGVLGDFSTAGTNTRYYIGVRTGGDPADAEKGLTQSLQETEKVKLVTPDEASKILNKKRDQDVLKALNAHLATHGNPHNPIAPAPPVLDNDQAFHDYAVAQGLAGGITSNGQQAIADALAKPGGPDFHHMAAILGAAAGIATTEGKSEINTGHIKKAVWMHEKGHLSHGNASGNASNAPANASNVLAPQPAPVSATPSASSGWNGVTKAPPLSTALLHLHNTKHVSMLSGDAKKAVEAAMKAGYFHNKADLETFLGLTVGAKNGIAIQPSHLDQAYQLVHGGTNNPFSTAAGLATSTPTVAAPPAVPTATATPVPAIPAPAAPSAPTTGPDFSDPVQLKLFTKTYAKNAGLGMYATATGILDYHLGNGDIANDDVIPIVMDAVNIAKSKNQKMLGGAAIGAAVLQFKSAQATQAKTAASPSTVTPNTVAPPAPAAATPAGPPVKHHVTIQSKQFDVDHAKSATHADVDDLKNQIKVSSNGESALKGAITSGAIATHGQLMEKAALTQASSLAQGFTSVNAHGFTGSAPYPTIESLLDAAHNGDATAKSIEAKLGNHSFQSPAAQKAAATAAQKAAQDAAFRAANPTDHTFKLVGGQGGYNKGALYELPDGTRNYVKTPPSSPSGYVAGAVAHNEHLANQIYQALGVSAPNSKVFTDPAGEVKYASQIIENKGDLAKHGITADVARDILKGFAADVLLGNHDVLGNGNIPLSNVVVGHDGKAHRIDNGGTMLFTGTGNKKTSASRNQIAEWDGFASTTTNANYAKVFTAAGVKQAEAIHGLGVQIKAISALRDSHGGWANFIAKAAPDMPATQQHETAQLLEARTKLLEAQAASIPGGNSVVGSRTFAFSTSPQVIRKELKEIHEQSGVPMTIDQKSALKSHQGSGYASAAAILLQGSKPSKQTVHEIQMLDDYFAKPGVQLGKDVALSRCMPMNKAEVDKLRHLAPGAIIGNTPVHQSTSTNPQVSISGDDVQLCILAPKETPGVPMNAYSSSLQGEAEVLLPRGLSYRVVAVMNPGDPDTAEVPAGWTWRSNAKNNGVRIIVEPIVAGVNDAENPTVPVHHINENAIKTAQQQLAAQKPQIASPPTPNLSGIHVGAPWNPGSPGGTP